MTEQLDVDELRRLLEDDGVAGWLDLGLRVTRGNPAGAANQVTVHHDNGEVIGWTEESPEVPGRRRYRTVIVHDQQGYPHGPAYPAGWLPPNPLDSQARERYRCLPEGHPNRPAEARFDWA